MSTSAAISFARGAPSLDIIDVEGLRAAADRAFVNDPGGTTAYGTAIGYVRLREWIAEHHGVEPARVLVTNGSMQADAFLFETLVQAGDAVVTERPPMTARCCRCADAPPRCTWSSWRRTGSMSKRWPPT